WPFGVTIRIRPGRSVTSMRPSGRKARDQGCDRPCETVWTVRLPAELGKVGSAACTVLLVARNTLNARTDRILFSFDAALTVRHRAEFRNTRSSYGSFYAWDAAV